jgi:uncharacterized Zn finger protein (UPF0148 family)
MARLQCRSCGFDKEIEWDGRLVCPSCGSTNARVAAATPELPDELFERIIRSLEQAGILDPNDDDAAGEGDKREDG